MATMVASRMIEKSWIPVAAAGAALVAAVELLLMGGLSASNTALLGLLGLGVLTLARRARAHERSRNHERARFESFEAHFRAVGEAVPQGIFLCDVAGAVTESNSRFRLLQGLAGGPLPPNALLSNVHPEERDPVRGRWLDAVAAGAIFRSEHRVCAGRGEIAVRVYAAPVAGPKGIRGYAGTVEDLTELKGMQRELVDEKERAQATLVRQLTWQATHDALTGLENRRGFSAALEAALARDVPHCLLFMDLDGFKAVNDACGHAAGDDLLKQVGELIGTCARSSDTLARLGGDEFAVLLENCSVNAGHAVAEKIRAAIDELRFVRDERIFQVGVSVGLVPASGRAMDADRYLELADAACYAAKSAGRNRVVERAADELERQAACESELAQRVQLGLRNEGFTLFAQAIRRRGEGSGPLEYRLLPRLFGADGQWIAPAAWLPVAARRGMTKDIRRWIIRGAVTHLAERPATRSLRFTVHLSASSIEDETLVAFIAAQIEAEGVAPALLAFELDLRSVLAAPAKAYALASAIRALGCGMIVCGFDGHSGTLSMLRTLPVDAVKLAPALVRDAAADAGHRAIAEAIRELAATFGREVIAEGVDTRELQIVMRDLGVTAFQGEAIASAVRIDQAMWPQRETLIDQPVPDGVVGELGVGPQVELFHQPRAVHAHGLRA